MKLIKKMIAASLAFGLVLSMSGCYWKGKTKYHSEQLILDALEEKYNEEFFIREIAVRSSYPGRPLAAYCSPKNDEELIFEVQYQEYEYDNPKLLDTYIQSIVRREMKEQFDSVLSEHFQNYAVGIYVYGTEPDYDAGITNASEASIKSYTESIPDDNYSVVWIALNKDDFDNNKYDIQEILVTIVENLQLSNTNIKCYYVTDNIIEECKYQINNNFITTANMEILLSRQRPMYHYFYKGITSTLNLIQIYE